MIGILLVTLGLAFVLLGSIGMVLFLTKFPFGTSLADYEVQEWHGVSGKRFWQTSWILIIAGTVLQMIGVWL